VKILEVCRVWTTHLAGGMPIAAHNHARALAMQGHEVTIVTTKHQTRGASVETLDGIEVHHLPETNPWQADGAFDAALLRFWDEFGPFDLIQSQSTGGKALIGLAPIILTLHGFQLEQALNELMISSDTGDASHSQNAASKLVSGYAEAEMFRSFSAVIVCSDACMSLIARVMGVPNSYRVYNGIDTEPHENAPTICIPGVPAYGHVILTACHLARFKGVHHLIGAMPEVLRSFPDAYAVICGEGPESDNLKRLAVNLGCSDRVLFLGEVPNSRMPSYLAASDVFFSGSYHFCGPEMNTIEAAASGIPIVGCDSASKSELLKHHETGFAYPNSAPELAGRYITEALTGGKRARAQVESARSIVRKHFTMGALRENLQSVINEVVK